MPRAPRAPIQGTDEIPQYRLTQPAYIDDTLYDQQAVDSGKAVIYYDGVPGPHMQPLNAAAKAMVEEHPQSSLDPIDKLTSLNPTK